MSTSDDKGSAGTGDEAKAPEGEGAVKPHVRRRVAKTAATTERASFTEVGEAAGAEASTVDLPRVEVASAAPSDSTATGDAGAPATAPRPPAAAPRAPGPRGTGKTGEGRWDMRAPSSGPRPGGGGFRGRPRPEGEGFGRRPGASGGRASPFIPDRDGGGRPVSEVEGEAGGAPRPGSSGGRAMPHIPQRDAEGRPIERGPRPDRRPPREGGAPRFDGPRPPRGGDGPREGGPRDAGARDGRPRRDGAPRPAEGRGPEGVRTERRPAPAPEAPAPKVVKVAETIFLGLPKAKIERDAAKEANKPKTAKEALRAKTLAAKPKPEAVVKAAKVELDAAWIGASADAAAEAARAAGNAGEALVEAWLKASNLAALVEVEAREDVAGAVRKAARRGLHALRSKGVALPERRVSPTAKAAEADPWEATFLPPDGRGTVAFTIARKMPDGRLHVAEVIARDPQGIAQAATAWLSRTQLREGHQRASARAGIAPVNVPVEWARARIAEARKLNAASGALLPLGLEACKELIEPAPEATEHPLGALEATLGDDAKTAPASVHTEPEFRGWLPDAPAIDEMLRNLGEALGPEGSKEPERVSKGLEDEVRNATDRFFTPEVRTTVARRLRDAAISVKVRLGEERAKELLATARAVERAGLITSPPREVPFLVAYFQKAVAILLQQGKGSLRIPMGTGVPAAL